MLYIDKLLLEKTIYGMHWLGQLHSRTTCEVRNAKIFKNKQQTLKRYDIIPLMQEKELTQRR